MNNLSHALRGEAAPKKHFLQFYETNEEFLDSLEAFISSGFDNGDGVVVAVTAPHLESLEQRLERKYNLEMLKAINQFIAFDSEEALQNLLVNDTIDENIFEESSQSLLSTVYRKEGGLIRMCGDTSALLWERGNRQAMLKLERLSDEFCQASDSICLFCAYPKEAFGHNATKYAAHICSYHNYLVEKDEFVSDLRIHGEKIPVTSRN